MLSLHKLITIAIDRVTVRLTDQKSSDHLRGMYLSENNKDYYDRLTEACHKNDFDIEELILMILPEKLFSKIAYLTIGTIRTDNKPQVFHESLTPNEINYLKDLQALGGDYIFSKLKRDNSEKKDSNEKNNTLESLGIAEILVCHGLSPIGDSIALIAEMGRVYRTATAYKLPINIMLADISWMSSNRSIKQFKSLNLNEIDNGLRICLDKRKRLYDNLNISYDIKEISFYQRPRAISGSKLNNISNKYIRLAQALWGPQANGRLTPEIVSFIHKPIYQDKGDTIDSQMPEHIKALALFPKVLQSIETHLNRHIEILRTVAKQFNSFDEEIFTYFFAQYYAQEEYKNKFLKIAPISESKFDLPFDKLQDCFKAWDEDIDEDIVEINKKYQDKDNKNDEKNENNKLPAIYLPQYKIGEYFILPYTPLSLDVLKNTVDHNTLKNEVILLSENQDLEVIKRILKTTSLVHRNRLLSDVLSFIIMCLDRQESWGNTIIENTSKKFGFNNFDELLASINEKLALDYKAEIMSLKDGKLIEMWNSWFLNIERHNDVYTPVHIDMFLFSEDEWDNEIVLMGFAKIIQIAIQVYVELTS